MHYFFFALIYLSLEIFFLKLFISLFSSFNQKSCSLSLYILLSRSFLFSQYIITFFFCHLSCKFPLKIQLSSIFLFLLFDHILFVLGFYQIHFHFKINHLIYLFFLFFFYLLHCSHFLL